MVAIDRLRREIDNHEGVKSTEYLLLVSLPLLPNSFPSITYHCSQILRPGQYLALHFR